MGNLRKSVRGGMDEVASGNNWGKGGNNAKSFLNNININVWKEIIALTEVPNQGHNRDFSTEKINFPPAGICSKFA